MTACSPPLTAAWRQWSGFSEAGEEEEEEEEGGRRCRRLLLVPLQPELPALGNLDILLYEPFLLVSPVLCLGVALRVGVVWILLRDFFWPCFRILRAAWHNSGYIFLRLSGGLWNFPRFSTRRWTSAPRSIPCRTSHSFCMKVDSERRLWTCHFSPAVTSQCLFRLRSTGCLDLFGR